MSETSQGVELYKRKERIACAGTRSCACGGKESILFSFSSMVAGIRVYSRLLASCYSSDDLRSKKALSFDSRVFFFLAKPSSFSISGSCRKRSESEGPRLSVRISSRLSERASERRGGCGVIWAAAPVHDGTNEGHGLITSKRCEQPRMNATSTLHPLPTHSFTWMASRTHSLTHVVQPPRMLVLLEQWR